MLDRLAGLETEYAIRFSPQSGERPGNDEIYHAIAEAVRHVVRTLPGRRRLGRARVFTENGGSLYYESLPHAMDGGLVEASTPECRGPGQLLLYQQAQEALLRRALPLAEATLRQQGHAGRLGLLKNCRDADGQIYGAQENYEVELARGLPLFLFRLGIILLLPLMIVDAILLWSMLLLLLGGLLVILLTAVAGESLLALVTRTDGGVLTAWLFGESRRLEKAIGRVEMLLEMAIVLPVLGPFALLMRAVGFRRIRRTATAFLVSRPAISGTGTVEPDGLFGLSEKGPAIRRLMRLTIAPAGRAIYDTGNLMKGLLMPFMGDFTGLLSLFRPRQRMQLGLADANRCQAAEYLKLGTTLLVIDMAEAGAIDDAPRLRDPVRALHALVADPTLTTKVSLRDGREMTGLELQRWYLDRARRWLAEAPAASMEAHEVVRLWGEALDALADDPGSLVGRIDWVTKRYLLETAGAMAEHAVRKKIDLRYHELGDGYLAQMEAAGLAPRLVSGEETDEAMRVPPDSTPARQRGRLVRELADRELPATASWDAIRIGGGLRGRVVHLDDFRRRREQKE